MVEADWLLVTLLVSESPQALRSSAARDKAKIWNVRMMISLLLSGGLVVWVLYSVWGRSRNHLRLGANGSLSITWISMPCQSNTL